MKSLGSRADRRVLQLDLKSMSKRRKIHELDFIKNLKGFSFDNPCKEKEKTIYKLEKNIFKTHS